MDRDTILENFLACTGITDITYGISVLEEHDWDLTAAASSIIDQGISGASFVQEDQSFPCSAVYSVAPPLGPLLNPESSVNYVSGTQNVSVSTMCGFETDFSGNNMSPTVSRSVVERDNDQTNLFGPVRILNFEIELELPLEESDNEPKVITESFPFPDTETVTFLKRHFIDCRLAELIQLATSPDLESKITEYTKTNLLKHLVLESSGSHSFSDNSAVLRSLHLPKCVKLRAKLSPNPLPDSSSLANQKMNQSNFISVYMKSQKLK
ncbi:unnamed protein product [Heterobilharzia americana]|nr:unnamed protein product [Heterobilharzia americana]